MRKTIVAGNWKMNASKESVDSLIKDILSGMHEVSSDVIVCAPFPYLSQVEALISNSNLMLGAQNLNVNSKGAFTGEVSANMIKDFGAQHVIVGHSERRSLYGESSAIVAEKTKASIDAGLTPILCVGESFEDRESGDTEIVVAEQLNAVISLLGIEAINGYIVAYEPVWAIGTGENAEISYIEETHSFIKEELKNKSNSTNYISVVYGGSVNLANCKEIYSSDKVDGLLIGGASLDGKEFA